MRIVSGSFKGRRFQAPKSISARPTTDFAKESLFNILTQRIDWHQTTFLDLYAGIGSIGLEAISRGASQVVSVDMDFKAVKWLKSLKDQLQIENWDCIRQDALKWLDRSVQSHDIVFADPPYDYNQYAKLIEKCLIKVSVNRGLFILEHRKNLSFQEHANFVEDRTYGEVRFSMFTSE